MPWERFASLRPDDNAVSQLLALRNCQRLSTAVVIHERYARRAIQMRTTTDWQKNLRAKNGTDTSVPILFFCQPCFSYERLNRQPISRLTEAGTVVRIPESAGIMSRKVVLHVGSLTCQAPTHRGSCRQFSYKRSMFLPFLQP